MVDEDEANEDAAEAGVAAAVAKAEGSEGAESGESAASGTTTPGDRVAVKEQLRREKNRLRRAEKVVLALAPPM